MNQIPFSAQSMTLAINASDVSSTSQPLPNKGNTLRLVNEGPDNCYVSIGYGSQVATVPPTSSPVATCSPVSAGFDICLTIPNDQIYNIAVVCRATETAVLLVQVGEGI